MCVNVFGGSVMLLPVSRRNQRSGPWGGYHAPANDESVPVAQAGASAREAVRPATRLSAERVLEIAREASVASPYADYLSLATPEEHEGKVVWIVSSATIGSSLEVRIADEAEAVLGLAVHGIR